MQSNQSLEIQNHLHARNSIPCESEINTIINLSKYLGSCPFYQKLGNGGVAAILLTAKEFGLPFMACLNGGLHNVDGKVVISAQLMHAMILRAGHRAELSKLDEKECVIEFQRNGSSVVHTYSFTVEDARKAGYLSKRTWINFLKDMLFARCLSGGARKFMPDVINGLYVQGELGEETTPVIPSEVKAKISEVSFGEKMEAVDKESEEQVLEAQTIEMCSDEEYEQLHSLINQLGKDAIENMGAYLKKQNCDSKEKMTRAFCLEWIKRISNKLDQLKSK